VSSWGAKRSPTLYARIFHGPARVEVERRDIVEYVGQGHAVFAGREVGTHAVGGGEPGPLRIRTTRYFRFDDGADRWRQ